MGNMEIDNIYRYIREDCLIPEFGAKLLEKHFDELYLYSKIALRIRELGHLLLDIKQI